MLPTGWKLVNPFKKTPEEILASRKSGQIYSFDFGSGEGKYISSVVEGEADAVLKISPKIEVRLTYILKESAITGIQLSKLNIDRSLDVINLTTMDWDKVLKLLHIFSSLDAKSIASNTLILDKSIVTDPEKLVKFLNTVAADPEGKKKFEEVANLFGIMKPGDLDTYALRKKSAELFDDLLCDVAVFKKYKEDNNIGKDEEVWQRFFKSNDWLLGSDVVEILEERGIDEDSVSDLPYKSIDGFLDIIELKLPTADFWTREIYPSSGLTQAQMQCMRYITEYERRFNDHKKIEEIGIDILKPRITLLYGRSDGWTPKMKSQFRILNSSYHNITILTYDHVLQRAEKLTGYKRKTR